MEAGTTAKRFGAKHLVDSAAAREGVFMTDRKVCFGPRQTTHECVCAASLSIGIRPDPWTRR
jgi:hypothetical protein